eukprot:GEMP01064613.1.p1 GENE.GEMP01064613.1~~GEMP01064613.1.p1  ORF type:complete len:224 (+),score=48.68 GEMP01064613.1:162-833(+)
MWEELDNELGQALQDGREDAAEELLEKLRKAAAEDPMALSRFRDYERQIKALRQIRTTTREEEEHAQLVRRRAPAKDGEGGERQKTAQMGQLKVKLGGILEQMNQTDETMEQGHVSLKATYSAWQTYDGALGRASKALGELKKSAEQDGRYIWYSFLWFCSVCAFVVLKRLKVFYLIGTILWMLWAMICPFMAQVSDAVIAVYIWFCATLDIPCIFDEHIIIS